MTVIPIPHTHPIWPPVTFSFPQAEASDEGSKIRHHWRDSRGIAAGTWHSSKKGLPGMLPSMAETLGPLYSCRRGVLWRWWRNLTSKVSKLLFTSTVLEILDTPLYSTPNQIEQELLEDRNCDGRMVLIKIWEYYGSRTGRKSPSTETSGHSFLRRPGPTRGCRANDDDIFSET